MKFTLFSLCIFLLFCVSAECSLRDIFSGFSDYQLFRGISGRRARFIKTRLRAGKIIPDVIPESFKPRVDLRISYVGRKMEFGTEYFPYKNETDMLPEIKYRARKRSYYSIAMVDPDAPSRANPFRAQVRHYLKVNIKGRDLNSGNSTSTPYLPARPFPGCGRKRFVWILAKQKRKIPDLNISTSRPGFNITKFVSENDMKIIGVNYFEVESSPGAVCTIPGTNPPTSSNATAT
ncbi:OV-16 antigen [Smittium mucronatum]|uniref:OV-16 antigen n=1 Tax=Smittium mucronatum TaxID=133383 RepID=A0A1R0H124_9FUNG|nr:OV-16 antigen [Smittium mucronatum]